MKRLLPAALALALPSAAAANGRIPTSVGVTYDHASDPVLAAMTFGLLQSEDAGSTYQWVCEQSIGITGAWDPQYVYLSGKIFASTPSRGVVLSTDGACSFSEMGAPIGRKQVGRLVLGADGRTLIAATNAAGLPAGERNAVYLSTDGAPFRETAIRSDTLVFDWAEPAAGDPMRLYAASLKVDYTEPRLHVSRDLGASAVDFPIPEPMAYQVQILGAERADPDVVYVRVRVGPYGKVYKTPDAGRTWAELRFGSITAAAYEPASHVLYLSTADVTTDPCTGQNAIGDTRLVRSIDGGASWQEGATDPKPRCLGFDADRNLLSCTFNSGNTLMARSTDRGSTFAPFIAVDPAVMTGTKRCPAGTPTHDMCEPLWPGLADQLGLGPGGAGGAGARSRGNEGAGPTPRARPFRRGGAAGCGGAGGAGGPGGAGGAAGAGGAGGTGGGSVADAGSGAMGGNAARPGGKSSGCAFAPEVAAAPTVLLLLALFALRVRPKPDA